MFQFLVNAEGGLTTAGYVISVAAGILLFVLALVFAGKSSARQKMSVKQLVFCAMAMALAFITSYIKLLSFPGVEVLLCAVCSLLYWPLTGTDRKQVCW